MAAAGKRSPPPLPHDQTAADRLLHDLFNGEPDELSTPIAQWITASKPFATFAQRYQRKIRKKIKICRDIQETYNLYCELRTAFLLLQEPKFAVAYEPYARQQGRSADFAVTFRTRTTFHVEVTRLRASHKEQQLYQPEDAPGESGLEDQTSFIRRHESRRLADVVCDKLTQMSPGVPNVLWVWGESRVLHALDIGQVMLGLKRRAEQRDADLFSRYGFGKPADFIRYYQRLSAILVQRLHEYEPHSSPLWWENNDTRHSLPSKVANLLPSLSSTDTSQPFIARYIEDQGG